MNEQQGLKDAYEFDIKSNPYDINNWTTYLDFLSNEEFEIRQNLYERAITTVPRSYKLWYKYLTELEQQAMQLSPLDELYTYVNEKYEQSLLLLEKMPILWSKYLTFLLLQPHLITHTRLTFNRALQRLSPAQHLEHIWPLFLKFADKCPSKSTKVAIWERYMSISQCSEHYINALIEAKEWNKVAIEYQRILTDPKFVSILGKSKYELWSEFLLILVKYGNEITTIEPEKIIRDGLLKYPHESAHLWCSLAKMYIAGGFFLQARDIYLEALNSIITLKDFNTIYDAYLEFEYSLATSLDEIIETRTQEIEVLNGLIQNIDDEKKLIEEQAKIDKRNAILGIKPKSTTTTTTTTTTNDDEQNITTSTTTKKKRTNKKKGLYGPFNTEEQLRTAYATLLHEIAQLESEFDLTESRIQYYTNCRDLYINNTLLRQNPHNVHEWFVRTKIFAYDTTKVHATFEQALNIVQPIKALGRYHDLWISLANLYLSYGQLDESRVIYEKAIFSLQQSPDAMVYIWCKYAEMEISQGHKQVDETIKLYQESLTNENENENGIDNNNVNNMNDDQPLLPLLPSTTTPTQKTITNQSSSKSSPTTTTSTTTTTTTTELELPSEIKTQIQTIKRNAYITARNILERATTLRPQELLKNNGINHKQDNIPLLLQQLTYVTKSLQIWSFYADLTECTCSLYITKHVYKKLFSLRIHTPSILLQYISLLLEHNYIEEAFTTFETAVKDFHYPIAAPIWLSYLQTFMIYYGHTKPLRTRDLFENAIKIAPQDYLKTLYLLFIQYEERYGTPRRITTLLQRACHAINNKKDKLQLYSLYIVKVAYNYGLIETRPVFQEALKMIAEDDLPLLGVKFIKLELKLNEIQRARLIYKFVAKHCNPISNVDFWTSFRDFETLYGTTDTFKDFKALERKTQQYFIDTALYRRALALQQKQQELIEKEKKELELKKLLLKK